MKINCTCGNEFEIVRQEYDKPFKTPCPYCRRSYELVIKLISENPNGFWRT